MPACVETAAVERDALAHADEAVTATRNWRGDACAVVGDLELERVRSVANVDARVRLTCVLERVRQRLLHDPEGGQLDADGQLSSLAFDLELDGEAGFPKLAHENRDVGEAGLGSEWFVRVAAEHAQQATHLGQRATTRLLDRLQHLAGRGVCAIENAPLGSSLENDHRDVMGDHVVQLAGDPSPLLDDCLARDEIPFALRYLHPSLPVAHDA